jgi:hypothetical protein
MSTPAQRKRAERERMRAAGYVQLTVWVPSGHEGEVRAMIAELPEPRPPADPRQIPMFDDSGQSSQ